MGKETPQNADPNSKERKQPKEILEAQTTDFHRRMLLNYPPTALALLPTSRFVIGGGGGMAKTGVPNRVRSSTEKSQHVD